MQLDAIRWSRRPARALPRRTRRPLPADPGPDHRGGDRPRGRPPGLEPRPPSSSRVALHRVFRSPHDVILWDTGHQAYVHKMLTGRSADFDSLRTRGRDGGLPVPDRVPPRLDREQPRLHRCCPTPTAWPPRSSPPTPSRRVVAVVGDGAMTGGMAFEGLNNIGHSGRKRRCGAQRQRAQLRTDRLTPYREPRALPLQPQDHAPLRPPRGGGRAHPLGGRHPPAGHEDVQGGHPGVVGLGRLLREPGPALSRPLRRPRHPQP